MRALLLAGGISMAFTLLGTPAFIWLFRRLRWGQFIREDGPQSHQVKHGTPTMGGIIIIFAALVAYLVAHLVTQSSISTSAVLILGLVMFEHVYGKSRGACG